MNSHIILRGFNKYYITEKNFFIAVRRSDKKYGAARENTLKKYTDQFILAKNVTIAINDSSYHFFMYDEPRWFYHQAGDFPEKK